MDKHMHLTQALSFSLLYFATAASYGSARVRGRARLVWLDAPVPRVLARLGAFAAVSGAFLLWHTIEPGPAAGFVVIVGVMVAGTLLAVLGPIAPRCIWAVAVFSLLAVPVLAVLREVLP